MDQSSLVNHKELLESQIRECYGKVVYSHKTHEKCADLLLNRNSSIKFIQLILSAITTGSFIAVLFGDGKIAAIIGVTVSTLLLILNSYTKDFELVEIADEHKKSADNLWDIRESYLSLLTDFYLLEEKDIIEKRDILQATLSSIYKGSPRTNYKGYQEARKSLKENEELTFSENEIDLLLPKSLRRNK